MTAKIREFPKNYLGSCYSRGNEYVNITLPWQVKFDRFFFFNMHYSYKNEISNWTIMLHLIQHKFLCVLS